MSTPTPTPTPPDFGADDNWNLAVHSMIGKVINDADYYQPGGQTASIAAYQSKRSPSPAFVAFSLNGNGFSANSDLTPDTARAIAAALIQSADLCDTFEAHQAMQEELEAARLNAGPIDGIARIELPGGVIAFEDAGEVAA